MNITGRTQIDLLVRSTVHSLIFNTCEIHLILMKLNQINDLIYPESISLSTLNAYNAMIDQEAQASVFNADFTINVCCKCALMQKQRWVFLI